jgi:hypothetical protein
MYIQPNRIISLGYGKFVRSDEIVAIEPIIAGRGPGRRSLVWMRGIEAPMVSSRTEEAILSDLIRPEHEAVKTRYQRAVLKSVVDTRWTACLEPCVADFATPREWTWTSLPRTPPKQSPDPSVRQP